MTPTSELIEQIKDSHSFGRPGDIANRFLGLHVALAVAGKLEKLVTRERAAEILCSATARHAYDAIELEIDLRMGNIQLDTLGERIAEALFQKLVSYSGRELLTPRNPNPAKLAKRGGQ